METQRLRNLTTGRLHTHISFIYQDLEFISGMEGIMTHMLPNVMRAVEPWLKTQVVDDRYWDGKFDTSHVGEYKIIPMNKNEREEMFDRYDALPNILHEKPMLVSSYGNGSTPEEALRDYIKEIKGKTVITVNTGK